MSAYKKIKINDFNYPLPDERIAKYAQGERGTSNLLIWNKGMIRKDTFNNLSHYLPENSLLIFNNTRVIHARLFFQKESGAKIEIFCLEPEQPSDYHTAFKEKRKVVFKCLVGNAKKWKKGILQKTTDINGTPTKLSARRVDRKDNIHIIEFSWNNNFSFAGIIKKCGVLPIPPYLKRKTELMDEYDYQTVYAKREGSVAAPTAGLHFTEDILAGLALKNIETTEITLHVGAGTFQPVKSETIEGHTMHPEKVFIPKPVIEKILTGKRKIIPVGTTSVRSIESLYWLGLKLQNQDILQKDLYIRQWEPYENKGSLSTNNALENIMEYLERTRQNILQFTTQIIIIPGYDFKLTDGMITNFHQPKSTLLLLISAFLGNEWKKVYDFALKNGFRFLSYGDSNLYLNI